MASKASQCWGRMGMMIFLPSSEVVSVAEVALERPRSWPSCVLALLFFLPSGSRVCVERSFTFSYASPNIFSCLTTTAVISFFFTYVCIFVLHNLSTVRAYMLYHQ